MIHDYIWVPYVLSFYCWVGPGEKTETEINNGQTILQYSRALIKEIIHAFYTYEREQRYVKPAACCELVRICLTEPYYHTRS